MMFRSAISPSHVEMVAEGDLARRFPAAGADEAGVGAFVLADLARIGREDGEPLRVVTLTLTTSRPCASSFSSQPPSRRISSRLGSSEGGIFPAASTNAAYEGQIEWRMPW
jgi:hypothetical protein